MRRRFQMIFGLAVVAAVVVWTQWPGSAGRTNIVLITFDTTRSDHMGAYGYGLGATQAFDQLAAEGVLFERAYATAPLTLVSHATMLTGLYPPEHGLRVNGTGRLPKQIAVLPEMLKPHGYATGAFLASFVLDSKFGLERGFDVYDDDLSITQSAAHSTERRRDGPLVVDAALAWLRGQSSRPFFCWIHLYDAHDPYDPRPALFGDQFQQRPYDAGIALESQQLDRVLNFLREKKLRDRTVVVVAGDHGEGLGDHGEEEHSMLVYDTTLHVPFVIAGPAAKCQSGLRIAEPVSLVDLTPTLLDLAGVTTTNRFSGRSLATALKGADVPTRPCYGETEAPFRGNHWCPQHAVILGDWKYIHTTRPELFNLSVDPDEKQNLAETDAEQLKSMRSVLEVMQENFVPVEAENLTLSAADMRKLAALGYVAGRNPGSGPADSTEQLPDMKDMLPFCNQIAKAKDLLRFGKFDEAGAAASEILAATDQLPMAHVVVGDVLRQKGKLDEAEAAYRKVLDRNPDNAIARAHLAVLFNLRGEFEKSVHEFREALKLDPEGSQTHLDLARTLTHLDQDEQAMAEYREAIRSDPGNVAAHFELGVLLGRAQRPQDAIKSFQDTLKYDPRFVKAYLNLTFLYLQSGRIKDAEEAAVRAVEIAPESVDARMNFGNLLIQQRRLADALAQFQEANRLQPNDPRPLQRIQQLQQVR